MGLVLLLVCAITAIGADAEAPPRPEGVPAVQAVAMALELALLSEASWEESPGSLDEARALLDEPKASPEIVASLALATAERWAGRADPSRRLLDRWPELHDATSRNALLDDEGPLGHLARISLLEDFCGGLEGSTHLPPPQAAAVLARSAGAHGPVDALEQAGRALGLVEPSTVLGSHRRVAWARLLAEARVPGPMPRAPLPRAQGLPVDQPLAPLIEVEPERLVLATRGLVSWQDGHLVTDPGPPAEVLPRWSEQAHLRWSAIADRRASLALAGIIALPAQGEGSEPMRAAPLLVAHQDLTLERLVAVLARMHPRDYARPCLLVRPSEHEDVRRSCVAFQITAPPGAQIWRLGPGGLHINTLPDPSAPSWAVPDAGARVEDLVLVLEEARHAGREFGLCASASPGTLAPAGGR